VKQLFCWVVIAVLVAPGAPAADLLVTVVERRTGAPVTDLTAADFEVTADRVEKRVEAAEYETGIIDVMLLLDSSLLGEAVGPLAMDLISQLGEKEQMAIVAYHSTPDLIQDFTGSQEQLRSAVAQIEFGNSPRLLDAIYAATREGFEGASFRRVILLLTSGVDGPSSVSADETIRLAQRNGVSIYPVFLAGYGRSLFERLAQETGGAPFSIREMDRRFDGSPPERIFDVMRGHYMLTLGSNLPLGDNIRVRVTRRGSGNLIVGALPLE